MTYLWLLRQMARITGFLRERADHDKGWWAWVAYYDGQIAFRQLKYVERVQKASGWEPVEVTTHHPQVWTGTTTTTVPGATFTYTWPTRSPR